MWRTANASLWPLGALSCPRSQRVSRCSEMHPQLYLRPKWLISIISRWKVFLFLGKKIPFFTIFWCAGLYACGALPLRLGVWGPLKAPRSQRGSRCYEMYSQPHVSPKWVIPDETIYFFHPFLVCRTVCPWACVCWYYVFGRCSIFVLAPSSIAFRGKRFPKTLKTGHITRAIPFQWPVNGL